VRRGKGGAPGLPPRFFKPHQHGDMRGEVARLAHIAGHRPELRGAGAMLPGVAIAARSAAAPAAVHPAARLVVDRGRTAGRTAAGTSAAARGAGEDVGLHDEATSTTVREMIEQKKNKEREIFSHNVQFLFL
jgi:hypothetical protein